jgi:hypothetical protein
MMKPNIAVDTDVLRRSPFRGLLAQVAGHFCIKPHKFMQPTQQQVRAQFSRLHISQSDFKEADSYLRSFDPQVSEIARRALVVAAIVVYARPFTNNDASSESRATSKVSASLLRKLTDAERNLHDRLLTLRNRAVAHSSYATRPIATIAVLDGGYAVESTHFDVLSEDIDVPLFQVLCDKLYWACKHAKVKLSQGMSPGENAV